MATMQWWKPVAVMIVVQVFLAGVNIVYKLALNDGMNLQVLVAYRYMFALAFLCPMSFFLERKKQPRMTWKIMLWAFASGLFGGTLVQSLFLASLKSLPTTIAVAITNLVPAFTFVIALIFRMEKLRIRSLAGQAKVAGTMVGIGGAMLLTFYKGVELKFWPSGIDLIKKSVTDPAGAPATVEHGSRIIGSLLALGSCFCYAVWLIIQAKYSELYPLPYSSTALMVLMGTTQAVIYAFCVDRNLADWKLGLGVRLITIVYSAVFASGIAIPMISWTVKKKGPLYVSVFNPVLLVVVAIASSFLLDERLHLGTVLGSVVIVVGLYMVLWGKGKDMKDSIRLPVRSGSKKDSSSSAREPVGTKVCGGANLVELPGLISVQLEQNPTAMPAVAEDLNGVGNYFHDDEERINSCDRVVGTESNHSIER